METPFNFGKVVVGNELINRSKEIKDLEQNFISHINTVLISPRRWGKSSLVEKVSTNMKSKGKNYKLCFIDLFSARNEEELYKIFVTEILKSTSNRWEEWVENGKKLIQSSA